MRVLICGDREWSAPLPGGMTADLIDVFLEGLCNLNSECPTVIEGCARGADRVACEWDDTSSVVSEHYPAKWDEHGKAAGPIRNKQMLDEGQPDLVLAFHDDLLKSKGTKDMVLRAKNAGVPVYLIGRA